MDYEVPPYDKERDILFKLNAMAVYNSSQSLEVVNKLFPKYTEYVKNNLHRPFREVEQELYDQLPPNLHRRKRQ